MKQHLGGIIKKPCLKFPEHDQSPKTNLKMFKFDNTHQFEKGHLYWGSLGRIRSLDH